MTLAPGATVSFQTPGGGGYGPALQRDPEAVLQDVIAEKVSIERARDVYGVVIDMDNRCVDTSATDALRRSR